eukprot:962257_1
MRKTASNEREFAWNTVTFWRRSNSVPKFTVALNNYATMLHHQLRRYCEAEKYYLRALRIDNCYSRAHFNYANLCREHINFDLAVLLIPPVTGAAQETGIGRSDIMERLPHAYCTIVTNRGPTNCKVAKYKPEIGDHYVRFYNDEEKPIKMSVQNSVEKKHHWQVDLFDLNDEER